MPSQQAIRGYEVEFMWRGKWTSSIFLSESSATDYAAKWHGIVYPLIRCPDSTPVVTELPMEAKEIKCPNNQSPHLSTTSETDS